MSAHTPGPWKTQWPKFNCAIVGQNHRRVATVHFDSSGDAVCEADANLVAAAPELLASLKEIMDLSSEPTEAMMQRATAAIAKAEGR